MALVILGNPAAIDRGMPIPGAQITTAHIPDEYSEAEKLRTVVHGDAYTTGVWKSHSSAPAPSWVESDDPELVQALADHYGCPIGRPSNNTPGA